MSGSTNGTSGRWALSVGRTGRIGRSSPAAQQRAPVWTLTCKLFEWAEHETTEIEDFDEFDEFEGDNDVTERLSGQLFNLITMTSGEPLQLLHNCNYNGAEAWRRLTKRYSPSSPLRAMQLMMQVIAPEKAKSVTDVRNIIEKWVSRVFMLQRDFEEKVGSKMKAAILISILPTDLLDSLIQQADKFVEYQPTKEKVIATVEAKIAMRSPEEMDVDELTWWNADEENENDEIHSLSKVESVAPASSRKARSRALQARAARTGSAARAANARANTNGPVSAAVVVSGDMDPGTVGPSSATRRTKVVVAKEEGE